MSEPAADSTTIPSGLTALFLTGPTCEIVGLRVGVDVTPEVPVKAIPKSILLDDIATRRAISDFQPYKDMITVYQNFPKDVIVFWYDAEWKYGQNFCICTTPEAADLLLNPAKASGAEPGATASQEVLSSESKVQRPKGWVSLGSEKEIEAERVVNTRDLIKMQLSRNSKFFGAAVDFRDHDSAEMYLEIKSFSDPNYTVIRSEINVGIQSIPEVNEVAVQTNWRAPVNANTQYESRRLEDGQCERIILEPLFKEALTNIIDRIERPLMENVLFDLFKNQYTDLGEEDFILEQSNQVALQEFQSFIDLSHAKDRSISAIEWHPSIKGVFAIAVCSRLTFDEKIVLGPSVKSKQNLILFWNFADPIRPQLFLEAPDDVYCFRFQPSNENVIVAGCSNGQIAVWDIAEYANLLKNRDAQKNEEDANMQDANGNAPFVQSKMLTAIEFGHRGPVVDLLFLPKGYELNYHGEPQIVDEHQQNHFITTSLDGHAYFWDIRGKKEVKEGDAVWKPFFKILINASDGTFEYGCTKMSLLNDTFNGRDSHLALNQTNDKGHFSSKFFCGTEEGDVLYVDWIADKKEQKASRVELEFHAHSGPVTEVIRSPFLSDILMTIGGWSLSLWQEGSKSGPILSFSSAATCMTAACWSPSRPSVFFVGLTDGSVQIWDLNEKSHGPVATHTISGNMISKMSIIQYPAKSQNIPTQYLAVGDDVGNLIILQIPKVLLRPFKEEKTVLRAFFDREVKHLGFMQIRKPNVREKGERTKPKAQEAPPAPALAIEQKEKRDLAEGYGDQFEQQYQTLQKSFLDKYEKF